MKIVRKKFKSQSIWIVVLLCGTEGERRADDGWKDGNSLIVPVGEAFGLWDDLGIYASIQRVPDITERIQHILMDKTYFLVFSGSFQLWMKRINKNKRRTKWFQGIFKCFNNKF